MKRYAHSRDIGRETVIRTRRRLEDIQPGDEISLHGRVKSVQVREHPIWNRLYLFTLTDGGIVAYPEHQVAVTRISI